MQSIHDRTIGALVVAAGRSRRMKDFKPMMRFKGKTLIENTVDSVLSGGAEMVVVVVGYRGAELEALLHQRYGQHVIIAWNREFETTDMLHSVQVGCKVLPQCDAFFLLPGDMPVVRRSTFQHLLEAHSSDNVSIILPTLDGYRKHPPLIDARLIPEILSFHGEGGVRQLWKQHESLIHTIPVDDWGVWMDLDTQEDYRVCKSVYEAKHEILPNREKLACLLQKDCNSQKSLAWQM